MITPISLPYNLTPVFAQFEQESGYAENDDQNEYGNDDAMNPGVSQNSFVSEDYPTTGSQFDDVAITDENSDIVLNILSNDRMYFDYKISPEIVYVSQASYGTVTTNSDGSIRYSPSQLRLQANSAISDTFSYTGGSKINSVDYGGQITVTVFQVNDSPRVIDSAYTITNDKDFSFYLKAYDEDNDKLTFFVVSDSSHSRYYDLQTETGMVTYAPDPEFTGLDFISYRVSDGVSASDLATVWIKIMENDADVASEENTDYGYGNVVQDNISYDYYRDYYRNAGTQYYVPSVQQDITYFTDSTNTGNGTNTGTNSTEDNTTPSDNNEGPVAYAGRSLEVLSGEPIVLDASGSYDGNGDTISYSWSQLLGPTVTLANQTSANPTFISPTVSSETTIIFELIVSDGLVSSYPSFVSITVVVYPEVQLDIVPNVFPNSIDVSKNDRKIPVAILGSSFLDVATEISESSLSFGPNSAKPASQEIEDVNSDQFDDLVMYFIVGDVGLQTGHKESCLSGSLLIIDDPIPFESCDSVVVNQKWWR